MKSDITRLTYRRHHHHRDVRLQQGRVLLDADWNEQIDIQAHLDETTNVDVIGQVGAPAGDVGFGIELLSVATNDFAIAPGHLYLDGILCESDGEWTAGSVTAASVVNIQTGTLDGRALANAQWILITAAGQTPQKMMVQSVAAGAAAATPTGVDVTLTSALPAGFPAGTAVKVRRVVTYLTQPDYPLASVPANVLSSGSAYVAYLDVWLRHLTAVDRPYIRERALQGPDTATRDQVVWQVRLSAQAAGVTCASWAAPTAPDGRLRARAQPGVAATQCSVASGSGYIRLENQLYRVEIAHGTDDVGAGKETFIWSRDNASMVAHLKALDSAKQIVTVDTAGPDDVLGFAPDQWVEVSDEERTLRGERGVLAQVTFVEGTELTVKWPASPAMQMSSFGTNPTVRRWDSAEQPVQVGNWVALEGGVQVELTGATFRTGDYWLVPARTVGGCVEWPTTGPNKEPVFQNPKGVVHHYTPLAVLTNAGGGAPWLVSSVCVPTFPPLTGLIEMYYVGGDGQECMPGATLPKPIEVGVANWQTPVNGALIRFTAQSAGGQLGGVATTTVDVPTVNGVASLTWQPAMNPASQTVEARLLDAAKNPVSIPIHFNANLSTADQVAYSPGACAGLAGVTTVQQAIERVVGLARLEPVSGDGQMALAGQPLPFPVQVQVVSDCGPVANATVTFDSTSNGGNGLVGAVGGAAPALTSLAVQTDGTGMAACAWQLANDTSKTVQQLTAKLGALPGGATLGSPSAFTFTGLETSPSGDGCEVTVGVGGQFATIAEAIGKLLTKVPQLCICLLPGQHQLGGMNLDAKGRNLTISACGPGTVVVMTGPIGFFGLASVYLRGLNIQAQIPPTAKPALTFEGTADIRIEGCYIRSFRQLASLIHIANAGAIRIADSTLTGVTSWEKNPKLLPALSAIAPTRTVDAVLMQAASDSIANGTAAEIGPMLETSLAGMNVDAERVRVIKQNVTTIERLAAAGPAGGLAAPPVAQGLAEVLYGDALVIMDGDAETTLIDDIIEGAVRLYGDSVSPKDPVATVGAVRPGTLGPGKAMLIARGGRISTFALGGELLAGLPNTLANVYSRLCIAESLVSRPSTVLAGTATLSGADWGVIGHTKVIAEIAVAIGNSGGGNAGLDCHAAALHQSANSIPITPV
jgi:hypothetical protein